MFATYEDAVNTVNKVKNINTFARKIQILMVTTY